MISNEGVISNFCMSIKFLFLSPEHIFPIFIGYEN